MTYQEIVEKLIAPIEFASLKIPDHVTEEELGLPPNFRQILIERTVARLLEDGDGELLRD